VRNFVFVAVSILGVVSCRALADQVSLKNGDRLSGTIVKSDGKTLALHTDYADDITLKWDAVQGIQSSEELQLELQDGRTVSGTVTTSDGKLQIATKSGGTVETSPSSVKTLRNDAEQATYEKTVHGGIIDDWKAGLNLGFSLTRGNSQTKNLSLAFIATRQTMHDKLGLYSNTIYAADDAPGATPSTTANAISGGLLYDHDIVPRIFGFVATDFFSDALQALNLRSVFSGGAGLHAIKNDLTTLDVLGGLNYTRESYTTLTRNFAALTLGEELMHKLGKSTALNERLYFFPDLNSVGEYRGTFDFVTVTKISKRLGWQNSFSDIYVTNPPIGKKKNDVIFTTGLNVSFGQ
jgi:putative salt-induced outer membrane protein YdiY/small nuclear ribonucleoprotein (snRNP)-like protein